MATFTEIQIGVYAIASALYLGYLLGFRERSAQLGRLVLALGVLLHFADIGARCIHRQNPVSSTPEAMAFVAFLIAAGFLAASFRYRLAAAGAFAVPAVLALLVLARVVPPEPGTPAMGTLGRTHIFLATVGVAVFTLAAVLAVMYLIEDRQLKRKRFGELIDRGAASLETLDRLARALRVVRFSDLHGGAGDRRALDRAPRPALGHRWPCGPEYLLAVATWVAFGVLLVARVGAGWRGRRAAWLTLGGSAGRCWFW